MVGCDKRKEALSTLTRELGERHLFQITNRAYPSRKGGVGLPIPEGMEVVKGSNGEPGSGAYLLDWDGKATGDMGILRKYREQNAGPKIWEHTMQCFKKATSKKRLQDEEADGDERPAPPAPNLVNWRPA